MIAICFRTHYNVVLKDMEVDGEPIELPLDLFDSGDGRGTIIDSGTTLAYLPVSIYNQLVTKVSVTSELSESIFSTRMFMNDCSL